MVLIGYYEMMVSGPLGADYYRPREFSVAILAQAHNLGTFTRALPVVGGPVPFLLVAGSSGPSSALSSVAELATVP